MDFESMLRKTLQENSYGNLRLSSLKIVSFSDDVASFKISGSVNGQTMNGILTVEISEGYMSNSDTSWRGSPSDIDAYSLVVSLDEHQPRQWQDSYGTLYELMIGEIDWAMAQRRLRGYASGSVLKKIGLEFE